MTTLTTWFQANPADPPTAPAQDTPRVASTAFDPTIIMLVGALMTLGVAMVYSASVTLSTPPIWQTELDRSEIWQVLWDRPLRQALFAVAGFLAMLAAAHLNVQWLAWRTPSAGRRLLALYILAVVTLLLMFVPGLGRTALGATRWITVIPGVLSIQPAEIAKIVLVIWLAALAATPYFNLRSPKGFLFAGGSGLILIGLVAVEDFGTGALMGVVMFALLVVGGARPLHLTLVSLAGSALAAAFLLSRSYRLDRLQDFFSGDADPLGAGYQIRQALLAIGSGGWWGRGLGSGIRKYDYLPQDYNDFILAIICEELGIVGGLVVVGLFVALLARGWWLAGRAETAFAQRLAVGLTLMICLQAAFNIGVVTQSVPTKGISLPFVSAGGSGIVFLGIAAGLLAAVGRRRPTPPNPDQRIA